MTSGFLEQNNTPLFILASCIVLILWILITCYNCVINTKTFCPYIYCNDDDDDLQECNGQNQSPIHIITECTRIVNANNCRLCFSKEHDVFPSEIVIINDGNYVLLCANWNDRERPTIGGGPLEDVHDFCNIRFLWGFNNDEGTEHMVNFTRFAMEMQVYYNNSNSKCLDLKKTIVVVSYFFKVTPIENPYLELIVKSLQYIKLSSESCNVAPFPISLLAPIFIKNYYTYTGSLTYPPYTEGVRWIIQPEPLTISSEQVAEFRKLVGNNGSILSNTRPVQCVNDRCVNFFK